ncbi:urotensin-2 [Loxodonta africana]|uniref:urotensin-2 n=1 Tax=Loxodonta africana TaxID=9785 RepID=UPI0030D5BDA8
MYKLASLCLLFIGLLNPFLSFPVTDSREMSPQLSADDDARLTLDELERASLLQILPEILSAKRDGGLEKAGKTILVFCRSSGFIALEFTFYTHLLDEVKPYLGRSYYQHFQPKRKYEKDAKVLLSHLLARTRKERKKHEAPSECFWKYCVMRNACLLVNYNHLRN